MNPQAQNQKKIVDVQFGPSPKATTVFEKNLIAVFDDGSIQAIGNYTRVTAMINAASNQMKQLQANQETWVGVKTICDAMPDFSAQVAAPAATPTPVVLTTTDAQQVAQTPSNPVVAQTSAPVADAQSL